MLFQLHGSIGNFVEMLLDDFKSHKPLHQLSQNQFIKMADHSCLMVGQRAKVVVLVAETKSITTTQNRFQPILSNCWSPARNTILCLFKTSEEEENHLHTLNVRSPQAARALCVAIQHSPSKSTSKTADGHGMSQRSVQRILQMDLKMFLHKNFCDA
jgi:hypothetical protein